MKSLEEWRNKNLYNETNENIWGHSKTPPYIPATEDEIVGNEEEIIFNLSVPQDLPDEPDSTAPSSQSSGMLKDMGLSMQAMNMMQRMNMEPRIQSPLPPFGHLGNSNLKYREPVAAGETPLLSKGMPIGNLRGKFESFGNYLYYRESLMGAGGGVNPRGYVDSNVVDPHGGGSEIQREPIRTKKYQSVDPAVQQGMEPQQQGVMGQETGTPAPALPPIKGIPASATNIISKGLGKVVGKNSNALMALDQSIDQVIDQMKQGAQTKRIQRGRIMSARQAMRPAATPVAPVAPVAPAPTM